MRILFLSQRFLLPMDTGGKIRTGKILEQLSKTHEVTLISNVESPGDDPYLGEIETLCQKFIPVKWKEVKKHSIKFYIRLIFQMFSVYPVSALNDYSNRLREVLEKECNQNCYDVAICDFVQSALLFKNISGLPTILFQHNVESIISKRHIEQTRNPASKVFWWLQWKKMAAFEAKACKSFSTVIAVSENDLDLFRRLYQLNNAVTIPTGVDINYFSPEREHSVEKNSLIFCGSMDWLPNEDAAVFFIRDILPFIKEKIPSTSLKIVGRNPSPMLKRIVNSHPEIHLTGWVEDTRPYIGQTSVVIVPIRIGGGTRMKIYEAMAMGKPVVSTSIGAEGLPVIGGENILIEDDPSKFAERVVELLVDNERRKAIGSKACKFVRENFAWQRVAEEFSKICWLTTLKKSARSKK